MPRQTEINFARLTARPQVSLDPTTGVGTVYASYIVGYKGLVNGEVKYQDVPDMTLSGSVAVALEPTDTSMEMFLKMEAAIMAQEGLSADDGDEFVGSM